MRKYSDRKINEQVYPAASQQAAGFSLLELAVVVAILGIISSLTIPNILSWVKLSKIEGAKAFLNAAAAECLQVYRENPENDLSKVPVENVNTLSSYGYKIKDNLYNCDNITVESTNKNDDLLFEFGFRIDSGEVRKFAIPASNSKSLGACENWAGNACTASTEQQNKWAAEALIQSNKKDCNDNFYKWLNKQSSGSNVRWDETTNTCSKETWAFEGSIQADEEGYKAAEKAKYGLICSQKVSDEKAKKTTAGPIKISECGDREFYFCMGDDKGTAEAMQVCIMQQAEAKCLFDRERTRDSGYNGRYPATGNIEGPGKCGEVVWMCNKSIMSQDDYNIQCKAQGCGEPNPSACENNINWNNQLCAAWARCKGFIP